MNLRSAAPAMAFALALAGGAASAQTPDAEVDAQIEQLRTDARAEVTDIIAKTMQFDADEAAKFWPLYKDYQTAQKAVGDEKVALIKDFADNYDDMTDAKAGELITKMAAIEKKGMVAKHEFLQKLQQVLPAKRVARYYQVDNRISMLAGLSLAEDIPLVK